MSISTRKTTGAYFTSAYPWALSKPQIQDRIKMMMTARPSVLLTRRWPASVETALAAHFEVSTNPEDRPFTRAALARALQTFDFICPTITDGIDGALVRNGPRRTKALCNLGAGVSHIDLAACAAAGLVVTNTPDVLTDDTADLAILLELMCTRGVGEGERLVRGGKWTGWSPTGLLGQRLSGKTLGIVGFGRIGQAVARRAQDGFGMQIVYASRDPGTMPPPFLADARPLELDQVFVESDVISLHVPGGAATCGLVDARRLALMKPTAVLINTARGDVIDEAALIAALGNHRIAAAGLDVYRDEPEVSPALRGLENVVLLPHLGSATAETRIAMGMRVKANLDAFREGREPPDRVRVQEFHQ
jgi:lactate dehydrogenase-like 2-hydroxyacid dehydrogenase